MATNETPEQFRERIGRLASDAEFGPESWEYESDDAKETAAEVAVAVYTQALRDVYAALESRLGNEDQRAWLVKSFGAFLAERDIDLTDTETQ